MPDNIYVLDLQVTGAELVTVNDDGAGEDAIAVHGLYDRPVEISLCWTTSGGQTMSAGAWYFGADGKGHRLIIKGIVENAIGSNGQDAIRGNELGNRLFGDHEIGGPGGDDTIWGGPGDDFVRGGVGADMIAGEADHDSLYGDDGNDTVNGGTGMDTVEGGAGADVLSGGGDAGDTVVFARSGAGVRVSLTHGAATTAQGGDAEGDVLDGFTHVTGSDFDDRITDTDAATLLLGANDNAFFGGGGRDKLSLGGGNDSGYGGSESDLVLGGAGDDALFGGGGRDRLAAGTGQDMLTGDSGADQFILKSQDESPADLADTITDFSTADGDRINLRSLDAIMDLRGNQAFTFINGSFQGQAGSLRVELQGNDALVMGDTDGDALADFAILVLGVTSLTPSDFAL